MSNPGSIAQHLLSLSTRALALILISQPLILSLSSLLLLGECNNRTSSEFRPPPAVKFDLTLPFEQFPTPQ